MKEWKTTSLSRSVYSRIRLCPALQDRHARALCVLAVLVLTCTTAQAVEYHLTDLGNLPSVENISYANDINNVGQVTGYSASGAVGGHHPFVWQNGVGMTDIGELPGGSNNTLAFGINDLGQVVGA